MTTPRVELILDAEQNLYHSSRLHAGLCALARRGAIILRYGLPRTEEDRALVADPLTVCLRCDDGGDGGPRLVAVDLCDRSDVFARDALERCDLYLKRSFHRPDLRGLPGSQALKVEPLGLNYFCRNHESTRRILRKLGVRLARRGLGGLRELYQYLVLPQAHAFEQDPETVVERTVLFQSRVWEPHETTGDGDGTINEERVALVRSLKDAFGPQFRGGLVPTPLALSRFPDEVSPHPTRRARYTAWSKRNLIGVYSRGVHRSTAAKLAEYLAASQCIVAEDLRNELPRPLIEGLHYLTFRTPEECVAACRRILADPPLAARMRRANGEYYRSEVEPAAQASRLLSRSLSPTVGPVEMS